MNKERLWEIDADSQIVTVSYGDIKKRFKGQWFQFLCCMIANDSNKFVRADAIQRLPGWRNKNLGSVGKEIAREIRNWAEIGLPIIAHGGKTEAWRLSDIAKSLTDQQDRIIAAGVLLTLEYGSWSQFQTISEQQITKWFTSSIRVMLNLTGGKISAAMEQLIVARDATENLELMAINDVLDTRIGQRLEKPKLPTLTSSMATMSPVFCRGRGATNCSLCCSIS